MLPILPSNWNKPLSVNTLLIDVSDIVSSLFISYTPPSDQKHKYLPKFTSKKYFPIICPEKRFGKIVINTFESKLLPSIKIFPS